MQIPMRMQMLLQLLLQMQLHMQKQCKDPSDIREVRYPSSTQVRTVNR